MKYTGGCHCGRVRYEVDMNVESVISCNCSICSKKGHLLAFTPAETFRLLSGQEFLGDYQFGRKIIHHRFCKACGVGVFGEGRGRDGKEMRAVNVRCLDNVDFEKFPVTKFNGRDL